MNDDYLNAIPTYAVVITNGAGKELSRDSGPTGVLTDVKKAKDLYRRAVVKLQSGGYDQDVAGVTLYRFQHKNRSVVQSTVPQTSRGKAQLAMGLGGGAS